MARKPKSWHAARQLHRTRRHEAKRRDKRNGYRPRTKPAERRSASPSHVLSLLEYLTMSERAWAA